jgi:hypothetical protein
MMNIKGCLKENKKLLISGEEGRLYLYTKIKFTRRKISKDFSIKGLVYRFLSQDKRVIFAIHKRRANVLDFLLSRFFSSRLLNP